MRPFTLKVDVALAQFILSLLSKPNRAMASGTMWLMLEAGPPIFEMEHGKIEGRRRFERVLQRLRKAGKIEFVRGSPMKFSNGTKNYWQLRGAKPVKT